MRYFRPSITRAAGHRPSIYLSPTSPIIKLNSNENPYPPSPKALDALKTVDSEYLRRYPDPYSREFCQVAAAILDVPSDWIIVGNGCDDLIISLIRACTGSGRSVVYPTPTYSLYQTLGNIYEAQIIEVPYNTDYGLPQKQILEARGDLTLIASPNSPTGHQVSIGELRQLASRISGVLVIDEAYVDFATDSALELVYEHPHVIVLRTLSKGYSLAGLRFGFGIAQPALLSGLFTVKDSYGVDAIATHVATAAIADQPYKDACITQIKHDRQHLTTALQQLGFYVPHSQGNFVLGTHPNARQLHHQLQANNIWVRYFSHTGLEDKLRITIGTPEQNQTLLAKLSDLL